MIPASFFYVDFNTITMFFCAAFLFAVHGNKLPTAIISYSCLVSGIALAILELISNRKELTALEYFASYDIIAALLLMPPFFFYMFHLMRPGYVTLQRVSVVYGPVLAIISLYAIIVLTQGKLPPLESLEMVKVFLSSAEMIIRIILPILLLIQTTYLVVISYKMYIEHKKNINNNFSFITGSSLKWVPWITGLIIAYAISLAFMEIKPYPFEFIASLILLIIPITISLMAVRQKRLFDDPSLIDEITEEIFIREKMTQTPLTVPEEKSFREERQEQLKDKLLEELEKGEIYKDPELSIDKVCNLLGTNRNYLYNIIKNDLDTSFYDLINTYRLNHAVALLRLKEYNHLKILHISEMVGFKNVSTFITLFKKKYNTTPNEWRNSFNLTQK